MSATAEFKPMLFAQSYLSLYGGAILMLVRASWIIGTQIAKSVIAWYRTRYGNRLVIMLVNDECTLCKARGCTGLHLGMMQGPKIIKTMSQIHQKVPRITNTTNTLQAI